MKSNGGVLSAEEVVHQPITTVLSGPAAGALGAALVAREAGFDRVLTCDGGGTSTDVVGGARRRADADHRGHRRQLPEQDPDDRRRDRGRRRRVGRLGDARGRRSRSGRGRPAPTPARSATAAAAPSRRSPTRTCCWAASRRTCWAARSRSTSQPPGPGSRRWAPGSGSAGRAGRGRDPGDLGLEPGQRAARGHRQARSRRPRLHHGDVRRVRVAAAVPAARRARAGRSSWCRATRATCPRSGCSPSTCATTTSRRRSAGTPTSTTTWWRECSTTCRRQAAAALDREGFARAEHRYLRSADLRYVGQAFEVRVPAAGRCGRRRAGRGRSPTLPRRARAAVRLRVPRRPPAAGGVGEPAGHRRRADRTAAAA